MLIQLLRIVIGAILLWYGSLYLIHTIEINELILNAVALEFVLRIDDILVAAGASAATDELRRGEHGRLYR